jgi:lipopolysaccharide transport system permease protein
MSDRFPESRRRLPEKLEYARDLLWVLVLKELRVRYKRTLLGYGWSLLQPLAFAAVYYLVFKKFIDIDTGGMDYTLFLVAGLFSWQWFANAMATGTWALIVNGPLIAQVNFPRIYAVLGGFLNDAVHFLLALPVILGFVLWLGDGPRVGWLWWLPLLLVIQGGLILGLSLLIASLTLFLRDLERLVTIGVLMLFHLTPVVYPPTLIPEGYRWVLVANPMGGLTVAWRSAFVEGRVDPLWLGVAAAWAGGALVLGSVVFTKLRGRFAEVV